MDTITINFKASGQNLTADAHPQRYASNTVNYIQAVFDLDENWQSFDSVRAVWHNDFACISTVLDSDGACAVPHEVLTNLDEVIVNLVGSDVDGEELVDRMTTYPLKVAIIDAHARICGTETAEVTPSQFEQYIAIVEQIVGTVKDIDHTELTDDYCLIIYYSDGTNSGKLGPIRGATGATGNGIVSAVLNADYTLTLTYDNGDSDTVGPIRGAQGETGNGIESVYLTETHGAVKTYTILFTDGTTTTFDVTDGEVTLAQLEQVLPTDTASGAIASFPDGSDLFDYLSCIVNIEPLQAGSGTPSPDNVRPITGWTGCEVNIRGFNLWDEVWESGFYKNTTGQKSDNANRIRSKNPIFVVPNKSYYFDIGGASAIVVLKYDISGNYLGILISLTSSQVINVPSDTYSLAFWLNGTTYNNDISINYPSTDHDYHAYNGTTYTVTWQTEAGTVYGGTVDVVTGVLFEGGTELVSHTLTDAEIDSATTYDYSGKHGIQISNVFSQNVIKGADGCCSSVSTVQAGASANAEYLWYGSSSGNKNVYWIGILDVLNMTLAEWKVWAKTQTIQLLYPITVTPTSLTPTPTQIHALLGQNNVWADCGNVEVQYKADVQRWVEKMLNA